MSSEKEERDEQEEEEEETKTPKLKKIKRLTINSGRCIHELELIRIIVRRNGWGVSEKPNPRKYSKATTKEISSGLATAFRRMVSIETNARSERTEGQSQSHAE